MRVSRNGPSAGDYSHPTLFPRERGTCSAAAHEKKPKVGVRQPASGLPSAPKYAHANHARRKPVHAWERHQCARPHADEKLGVMLQRIKALTEEVRGGQDAKAASQAKRELPIAECFLPIEPESFAAAGLTETMVESLILKFLLARGDGTGREVADQIKLPFILVDQLLRQMKNDQLVVHKGSTAMNDFQYHLGDLGRERARRHSEQCTYFGARRLAPRLSHEHRRANPHRTTPQGGTVGRGVFRLAPQPEDARPPRSGDQFRPRTVPLWSAGQRKDEHRRAGDAGVRPGHLDSAGDRRRRPRDSAVRSGRPRGVAPGGVPWPLRPAEDRQALGPHPAADASRRRRTDLGPRSR